MAETSAGEERARVDRWLWTVRIYRTRAEAAAACRAGAVVIGEVPVKPARELRPGDRLAVRQGVVHRTVCVRGFPAARVGAARVAEFADELTPPEEWEKARPARVQHLLAGGGGSGRPTARERRDHERFFDRLSRPD